MIDPDLSAHLIHIISWHRTWLDVVDFDTFALTAELDAANRVEVVRRRVLRLEVRIRRFGYRKRRIISIPEPAIERAIQQLSADSGFRRRLQCNMLTCADLNRLMELASDGAVHLELE